MMTIRAAAKAVITQGDSILLQCCVDEATGLEYYELPGGGQQPGETMEEAIRRECLEETGFHVEVLRFFALSEEIITIPAVQRDYPLHAHRIFHIFLCRIQDQPRAVPSEVDFHQVDVRWFPVKDVPAMRLRPTNLRGALASLLASGEAGYLGTSKLDRFDI